MMKKATKKEAVALTSVVWDINKCPVPDDCDPRVVRPSIKRLLENYGYRGPLTVTAFGQLADVPVNILRAVFSSGISLTNVDPEGPSYIKNLLGFPEKAGANFMVISDRKACPGLSNDLQDSGCNPLQPFPLQSLETLLMEDSGDLVSDTVEPALWDCFVCARDPPGQTFDNLITHLFSDEHLELLFTRKTVDWEAVKSLCPTFVFWDINSCPVPPGFDASLVGPCIKRFLKNEGCSGPLTIVAIGELTDIPNDILRKVYSSGINLHNVPYGPSGAYKVIFDPSPIRTGPLRNIMLISSARIFAWKPDSLQTECNFLEPYPCDSLQILCLADSAELEEYKCRDRFCICSVCNHSFIWEGIESFSRHLSGTNHQQKLSELLPVTNQLLRWNAPLSEPFEENLEFVTAVFWDIKTCPVPPGCDPRRVGPCIKQFLENKGYSGPLTITAIGVLTDLPNDILRGIHSSGIALNNIPYRTGFSGTIDNLICQFTRMYPPPANIMVISNAKGFNSEHVLWQQPMGYTIIEPVPFDSLESFFLSDSGEVEEDKCSESAYWSCSVCDDDLFGQGFDNFTSHVTSRRHQRQLLDWLPVDARFRFTENALDQAKVQDLLT
ncbi:unnamed protein product [Arabidopsis halleri]